MKLNDKQQQTKSFQFINDNQLYHVATKQIISV